MRRETLAERELKRHNGSARGCHRQPGGSSASTPTPHDGPQSGPDRAILAAGVWSLAYALLGLFWTAGGTGYPFGSNDPAGVFSALAGVQAPVGAPAIAVLGLLGTVVAVTMARGRGRGIARTALLAFAWIAAITLLFVVPDARTLVAVAYLPVFLLGALSGWMPGDYRQAVPWTVLNQFVCVVGGFLWVTAAIAYHRRGRGLLGIAGGTQATSGWTTPGAAARWGRLATIVAIIVPLIYAVTRWAWKLGIPLGIDERLVQISRTTNDGGWAGASLGTVAICGALLTLGLTQRWGERFPRWLPIITGRRVPPALAIVPATIVSVLVTSAGLTIWRRILLGNSIFSLFDGNWAAVWPALLWPIWGIALGAATLAYYFRRQAEGLRPRADGPPTRLPRAA